MMADQNKNQSNQNKQSGQQGSQRNQSSGTDETYRTQDQNQNQGQRRQGQGPGESIDDETMGEGGRSTREPAHTADDRGVGSERRNVSSTDSESLDRES